MHIVRYRRADESIAIGVRDESGIRELAVPSMAALLQLPVDEMRSLIEVGGQRSDAAEILPPIDNRTEVWASGVTYERSRKARMEESSKKSVYDLVYHADRPELFFKAPAWRVVTDGEKVAIRADSPLNVPEPELAVVINSRGEIVGYLVCNDMSSRSIEGENPLYLPQAKFYAGSCAISDGIRPAWEIDVVDLRIGLTVRRERALLFEGKTTTAKMHRTLGNLLSYLTLEENFPDGVILSTGTGIVPDISFSLAIGDEIEIEIESVGTLTNAVTTGKDRFDYLADSKRAAVQMR